MNDPNAGSKRLNVLVLDGGGVRGLSSLLILQALMLQIKHSLTARGVLFSELHPHHVFRLVAGTSTGGLIALMIGKMGMTVEECISKYENLSKVIFGKKHIRSRITHGLAPARYSGKRLRDCIRKLLRDRHLDEDLLMSHQDDKVACAVICREHCSSSQYSTLTKKAVPICSLPCNDNLNCKVCDAARATSAAPTFFPVMRIEDRFFMDGGIGNNNPSFAIYFHYTSNERKKSTKFNAASEDAVPAFSPHGDLDCSCVRFTNIGTGAKAKEVEVRKRDWLAGLIPGFIQKGVFLKQTLTEIAVNSEKEAEIMTVIQHLNGNRFMYARFDANHGVSNIKMDDHKALGKIREKTEQYLEEPETRKYLEEVGSAIATDYIDARPIHGQDMQPADSANDKSRQPPKTPSIGLASSSLSSGPSSHSNYPESESQVLFPNNDNLAPAPLVQHPAETQLRPNGQGQSKDFGLDDSGIDVVEPETLMAAAPT